MTDKTEAQPEALRLELHQECADFATSLRSAANVIQLQGREAPPSFLKAADLFEQAAAEIQQLKAQNARLQPTIEDDSQEWAKCDPAIAFHLIERHSDNWADAGKMMTEFADAKAEVKLKALREELTTQTNRAAAAEQQVTALTQRLDSANALNTEARNQLAQLSARQAAPVGTAPIKDRLLCALERAAAAETALRRLVDECENDKAPGWEDRMLDCIAVANALLAAPPPPEREPLTDEQIFAIAKDVFPGNAHELIHETSPDYARACGMEPGARWTCSEVRPGQTLALSRAIERKHGIGATNAR